MSALIIARRPGQTVHVEGPCTVVLDRIEGNKVRLVFLAEREVTILRGELLERKPPSAPEAA